ncbi:hypothetical protein [Clostridium gasigenes]|uniref:Uncharacterized protein n=1 Tax=Clostridium gasigenes TaxID=94869 RepID=A0A7X0SFH5_9CLOT|nr:hypothetical protein [Clostridium gasigenes]MBB6716646.1 hypothetical protein [Clostridium gasigenes]
MKKQKGEIQQFFIQMIGIVFSFAILLQATYYLSTIITYNNINQISRKYILKMERQGYLDSNDRVNIESEIKNSNVDEVDIVISAEGEAEKVKYGEDIRVTINCKIKQKNIDASNFSFKTDNDKQSIEVIKASTARW